MSGNFFVIYGSNNLGKSIQAQLLAERLMGIGLEVQQIKYPIYDTPTGQRINAVIRRDKKIPAVELQNEYAQNRRCYEPTLIRLLESGITVVAEDYTGTGKAWGLVEGIPLEVLDDMNEGLEEPDLAILMDGQRFESARESDHRFENGNWDKARQEHLFLAERYGWEIVNANQSVEKVHQDIWKLVYRKLWLNG